MARPPTEYGCWPNEPQRLLLQAALLDGDRASTASRAWCARIDLDLLDAGSLRLLPLLYRAMTARGESWTHLGRLAASIGRPGTGTTCSSVGSPD
jgi:hypothetical protein